jgi:hypothetical protein
MTETIPDGYWQDANGRLVPTDLIKDIDKARHELVMEIVAKAKEQHLLLVAFKASTFADISAFVELSAEKYNAKVGGNKGNITLMSFDGKYKLVRQMQDNLAFDERLQAAKALIDACIKDWTQGSRSEIKALIDNAFQVDKEGKISTGRVLGLRRLDIQDPQWQSAMQAISDSVQVLGSKPYIRIYERVGDSDNYQPISLDLASI